MTDEELAQEIAGLQHVYRGVAEGVAMMPDGCPSARTLEPLVRELEDCLGRYAFQDVHPERED
jgi:hypothetical protein